MLTFNQLCYDDQITPIFQKLSPTELNFVNHHHHSLLLPGEENVDEEEVKELLENQQDVLEQDNDEEDVDVGDDEDEPDEEEFDEEEENFFISSSASNNNGTEQKVLNQHDFYFPLVISSPQVENYQYLTNDDSFSFLSFKNNSTTLQGLANLNELYNTPDKKITIVLDLDETLIHSFFNEDLVAAYLQERKNPTSGRLNDVQASSSTNVNMTNSHLVTFKMGNEEYKIIVNKRPHVDNFLKELKALKFEIVLFTAAKKEYAQAIIDQVLDPHHQIFNSFYFQDDCEPLDEDIYALYTNSNNNSNNTSGRDKNFNNAENTNTDGVIIINNNNNATSINNQTPQSGQNNIDDDDKMITSGEGCEDDNIYIDGVEHEEKEKLYYSNINNHSLNSKSTNTCYVVPPPKIVKNLSILNRNLNNVIIIDNSPLSYSKNQENAMPITSWYANDSNDCELDNILHFLKNNILQSTNPSSLEISGVQSNGIKDQLKEYQLIYYVQQQFIHQQTNLIN